MGEKLVVGVNDFASNFPELVKEWDVERNSPLTPQDLSFGSHKKVYWLCQLGHSYLCDVGGRARGRSCPFCSGNAVLAGLNDLRTTRPELIPEWDVERNFPLTMKDVSSGHNKKLFWLCKLGHSHHAAPRHRQANKCPFCSGKAVLPGYNDLATIRPDIAAEWDKERNSPITPLDRTSGSNKKAFWLCPLGHSYSATINDRCRPRGSNCPFCSGGAVLEGFNDIAFTAPEMAKEWGYELNSPLTPMNFSLGSHKKVFWLCPEGHSYKAAIGERATGTGCPRCASYGFDATKEALFYFIENKKAGSRKVGITNTNGTADRVKKYGADWLTLFSVVEGNGRLIKELEIEILTWIRKDLGLPKYLEKGKGGLQSGHTETFSIDGPSNAAVIKKISETLSLLKSRNLAP